MEELADFRPGRNEKKKEEQKSNLFDIGENFLLPIILIFMLDKNSSNFPVLDNIKDSIQKVAKDIVNIPMEMNLSTADVQEMINAVNSVEQYMNPDNLFILDTFSDFLSAMHKISTVKEFRNDMTRSSPDSSRKPLKFKNQKQKALHMIGTLEQFMDEPTKKNMESFKNTLSILDKFEETGNVLSEKRKNGGNIDIKDIIQFIGPLLGGGNFPDAQKIDSMIRMVQIMSALDDDGGGGNPTSDSGNVVLDDYDDDDGDGSFFEFVIDRYDDEDDG